MKDYYYLLGLSPDANDAQIRMAFKELSIKFHPDRNGGDKFFEDHFKEIQEAYAVLSDAERRRAYDRSLLGLDEEPEPVAEEEPVQQAPPVSQVPARPPLIQQLSASKEQAAMGDLLTLSWRVSNADYVYLSQVGEVEAEGTKTLRVPHFAGQAFLIFTLVARNSALGQAVERQLLLRNKDGGAKQLGPAMKGGLQPLPSNNFLEEDDADEVPALQAKPKSKKKKATNGPRNASVTKDAYMFFLIFMLIMLAFVVMYGVWRLSNMK